ncbi:MAG: hypothetical protein M1299_00340 [Firmicutes bacterium]|nr:hypothetical protein [Bacillota bacterium]MCL5038274.1 hypothetical protein [Bacillota bacterium]
MSYLAYTLFLLSALGLLGLADGYLKKRRLSGFPAFHPLLGLVLGLFLPGAPQIMNGQILKGGFLFLFPLLLYAGVFPFPWQFSSLGVLPVVFPVWALSLLDGLFWSVLISWARRRQ